MNDMGVYGFQGGQDVEEKKFLTFTGKLCSRLGFAMVIIIAASYFSVLLWSWFLAFLVSLNQPWAQEACDFLLNTGTAAALSSLCGYLASIPLASRLLRRYKEEVTVKKKMRISKFLMFLVLAMGLGYMGNIAGNTINTMVSAFTGKSLLEMNPVNAVMNMLNWPVILMITVMAPLAEEWIFRKMILNRVLFLGEKRAIVFTAVSFGLMHGNVGQTIFAIMIGMVLGYVAVKTGRLLYCVLLHMIINSYSVIIALLAAHTLTGSALFSVIAVSFLMLAGLSVIGFIAAAAAILVFKWKKAVYREGKVPACVPKRAVRRAVYLNAGMIFVYLIFTVEALRFLL